jgi:hypothetical protein
MLTLTKSLFVRTLPMFSKVRYQPLHGLMKPQHTFFSSEVKPSINLREIIPHAKDAKQILMENPGITFIGVFNHATKEITLMPGMKENNLELHYSETGDITKGRRIAGKELNEEELRVLNDDAKLFLARRSYKSESNSFQPPHTLMLTRMGMENNHNFYGFSVTQNTDGSINFRWNSRSLNDNKPGTIANQMRPEVQEEIKTIIQSWSPSAAHDEPNYPSKPII